MHNGEVQSPYTLEAALVRINQLEHDVARKYAQTRKLKRKVALLNSIIDKYQSEALPSQSATMNVSMADDTAKAEITTFADESAGWNTTVPTAPDSTFNLANNSDSDLGNFLCRPINVATYQWDVDSPLFETLNPWTAYLTNPFIRDKIANFELLRMNLHMKVLISGTPFHYGRALVSYNPLSGFDQVTIERGLGGALDADLVGASQKPHIFLNPTLNAGGVLEIPYFYKENYIPLTQGGITDGLGEVVFRSFGNLRHTDVGNPVTINVYLWATDVTLTMPTSRDLPALPSQSGVMNSGDEYGQGIISKPASAIAKAAGMLKSIPLIRPYARATEIVATGVGDVARLFGYSRPAVITDPNIMKPVPLGNVANVDAADAVYKLTLDSKNEVTVDPRVTGLEGRDEMSVVDYVKRESYLATFNWTSDAGPGDMLWNCRVAPDLFRRVSYTTPSLREELHMIPACHMAQMFKYWQGSIKFRFQIVKSAYHKGRMLVRYDPRSLGATVDYNTNYSRVIDIADAEDFEITIGWGQHKPWLECEPIDSSINFSPGNRLNELFMRAANGVIELDVINELVSPNASSDISVNVYVSMCDDARFAQPDGEKIKNLTYFRHPDEGPLVSQSGIVEQDGVDEPLAATQLETIASEAVPEDQTMNVFFGENVTSIRELVKRYVMTRYWYNSFAFGNGTNVTRLRNKTFPYQRGYDPEGLDTEQFGAYNNSNMNPISYFQACYAGYRGSIRHKYLYHTAGNMLAPVVEREDYSPDTAGIWSTQAITAANSDSGELTKAFTNTSWQGAAGTGTTINNGIEVEFPFYNKGRIGYSRLIRAQDLDCPSTSSWFATGLDYAFRQGTDEKIAFQQWTAAGEDFSLYFFTGVPIMYQYTEP
ncbi:hypothetical protein 2 [Beihai mollusks virus 1]|uniref:hypothetical protein 2 n=1 Tax=Beihai mollusks virus 1 TaxID=1922434 RepID=UPI00090940D1|nr:hypothetical protein 2 [Beihai mollusks virus 1]APG78586.1 hypothetical protein 2 [Beihai mollusks virus 1]